MGNILFWLYLVNAVLFAFTIHMYFIKKGRNEFKVPISLFILISTLDLLHNRRNSLESEVKGRQKTPRSIE